MQDEIIYVYTKGKGWQARYDNPRQAAKPMNFGMPHAWTLDFSQAEARIMMRWANQVLGRWTDYV